MKPVSIKGVSIQITPDSKGCLVEEKFPKAVQAEFFGKLFSNGMFESMSIEELVGLGEDGISYRVPLPNEEFPKAPKNDREFGRFLTRAISLVRTIQKVHQEKYCFGLLGSQRFLVNKNGKLIILGLGLLQKKYSKDDLDWFEEKDFYFLAPEFSKRSNKRPDSRSDFYGLGVLLHFWLTGRHFINAVDKQEILYKHLTEPYAVDDEQVLWKHTGIYKIIQALLEKRPEDRYQSAHGVLKDLLSLESQHAKGTYLELLPLSTKYNPGVLNFPQGILERGEAVDQLMAVYQKIRQGESAVVFVEGAGGMGKTTLGNAFESAISESDTLFSKGSFDESQATPYKAFQRAFQNIAQRILIKSGKSHAEIKNVFISGLGSDLSALFGVIPDLKELTGSLPQPETLDPLETGDRFVNLFARYCRTLDGIGLKRVLFIDDVQWCDLPSLKLIEYMAWAPISRVMFVLSYNPEGMSDDHPLRKFQNSLKEAQMPAPIIKLMPLSETATQKIVADALSEEEGEINELAKTIHKKTHGNPYYIQHFLRSLQDDHVLTFDEVGHRWQYNLNRVKQQEVAENVLAVYEKQLLLQSYQAQVLLKVAAYDNGKFNIPLLTSVCGFPQEIVVLLLELLTDSGQLTKTDTSKTTYVFSHKRIERAALSLHIPDFDMTPEVLHKMVAEHYLLKGKFNGSIELNQFVEHLLESRELIHKAMALDSLPNVLQAAQLANDSNSPHTAQQYLDFALAMQEKFQIKVFRFDVLFGLAKAFYLLRNIEKGQEYAQKALFVAEEGNEQCSVHLLNMKFFEAYSLFKENLEEGIRALGQLGVSLRLPISAKQIEKEYEEFRKKMPDNLEELGEASSNIPQGHRHLRDVLVNMCTSAQRVNQNLYAFVLLRLGNLNLKFGRLDSAPFTFIHLGTLLCCRYQEYKLGLEWGDLGLKLLDKTVSDKYFARTVSIYHGVMAPLKNTYKALEGHLDSGIEYCMDRGDAQGLHNLLYVKIRNKLLCGADIKEFLKLCDRALKLLRNPTDAYYMARVQSIKSIGLMLAQPDGKHPSGGLEISDSLLKDSDCRSAMASHHILVGWVYCLQRNYKDASDYFLAHKSELEIQFCEPQFFKYLALQSVCDLMLMNPGDESVLQNIKSRQQRLKSLAMIQRDNFAADHQLVELLLACRTGKFTHISEKIEEALCFTEKVGALASRAMLADVLHQVLPEQKFSFLKRALKHEASTTFREWGVCIDDGTSPIAIKTDGSEVISKANGFDFQSLIKATQTISAEVNKNQLVQSLLKIVMENAGADKGALVLLKDTSLVVSAFIDLNDPLTNLFSECELNNAMALPMNLIEHVALGKKELCIDDLAEYSEQAQNPLPDASGSLLLLPLIKQNDLIGVLYIANSQMTGMFSQGGLEVFRIIASQAAISIANSTLYEQAITLNRELASSQRQLAKLNQALEGKIKERTQHLRHEIEMRKEAERDLIYAKNDADNANRAKSQFLANMSHEIRTPLNAIVGFAQILEKQSKALDLTYSFRRYLNNIHQSAESLSEIIRDILDLSKIEAGKTTLVLENMDLRQLFYSVYRIQNSLAKSKGVRVVHTLAKETPRYIHSDRGKIKQILMNIVGNAVKFTPESNSVRLSLNVRDQLLVFEVKDEGIGIPASDLERIFEPFTQSDAGTDRKYGGTGLGLAITKSLVGILGGKLMVSSEEGRGTCFTIEIPFETAAPPQSEHPETLLANYRVPANSKILVVEDHPMNQEMIRALFSELGSEIYLARSGSEGISMVERYCPDIVFMDIHMPEIDGYETFEKIQKLNPNLPVVGLSADAFKEHQEAALKAGFSAYLTKPIQLTKLVSVLRQFLQFPVTENPRKRSLNKQQSNQKKMALQAIKSLPIFETEKLVSVAASLSEILPATDLSKLEDAIYAGDDAALQEFLTNSLDG